MEPKIDKPVRTRRSHGEISQLLNEFEKANVSVKEFCTLHNISQASFHNWRSKNKRKTKEQLKPSGFTALQITPSLINTTAALFAEVKGPDSYRVKIYQPVAASYLKELLV